MRTANVAQFVTAERNIIYYSHDIGTYYLGICISRYNKIYYYYYYDIDLMMNISDRLLLIL